MNAACFDEFLEDFLGGRFGNLVVEVVCDVCCRVGTVLFAEVGEDEVVR